MAKTIENLFFYLIFVFDFLIILLASVALGASTNKKILWISIIYCFLNSVCNFLPILLSKYFPSINPQVYEYPILVLFTITEYLLLAYLFSLIIKNRKFHNFIYAFSIIFFVIVLLNYNAGKSQIVDSLPIGVETILVILYSFYYLYEQMNILDESFIYNRFHFWMVIGIMIYLAGSFFIYIYANHANSAIMDDYWFLTYAFYIIKNIFFAIGIVLALKEKKPKKPALSTYQPYLN